MNGPVSPVLSAIVLLPLGLGCSHIVHPAAVQPGVSAELLVGQAHVRHEPLRGSSGGPITPPGEFEPRSSRRPAMQVGLGYGWRFSPDVGVQVQAWAGKRIGAGLAGYLQLLGSPLDAGVGLSAALGAAGPYVMVGRGRRLDPRTELRLDGGVRLIAIFESYPTTTVWGWGPMALVSLRRGPFAGGVWADGLLLDQPSYDMYCDETCDPDDFLRRRVTVGLYFRVGTDLFSGAAAGP